MIQNPILPGFNPDPSILRVGDDYYIATSTFEWFPGVQIHHSRDLANWELVTRPLTRKSQLDMRGDPDSCGVWAPAVNVRRNTFIKTKGVARMYSEDLEQLEAGMPIYDAFYRWCRDAVDETHDWVSHQPRARQNA